ncbi:MAG: ABC transporter permease subunit [Betaproteobacteria bacterium]|nr:ABC transporter permease subunit [Betaproteobacteria bacterium]
MIFVIAAKELRSLFGSPLAWVVLAVLQIIFGYSFLVGLDRFLEIQPQLAQYPNPPGATELIVSPTCGLAAIILLMIVPLLSMRLIAEERRNQTLTFLLSAPVSITQIVLGKFLGLVTFLLLACVLLAVMAVSLYAGGRIDLGLVGANLLGLVLLASAFAAVGLYLSSLTAQPVVAAVSAFAALLLLWIINMGASDPNSPMHLLSLLKHYESFAKGTFHTGDFAYFVLLTGLFLALSVRRLDRDRLAA